MQQFCGILTLALNTSGALWHQQLGSALVDVVDVVGPARPEGFRPKGAAPADALGADRPPPIPLLRP
jgi:hypothetical protein